MTLRPSWRFTPKDVAVGADHQITDLGLMLRASGIIHSSIKRRRPGTAAPWPDNYQDWLADMTVFGGTETMTRKDAVDSGALHRQEDVVKLPAYRLSDRQGQVQWATSSAAAQFARSPRQQSVAADQCGRLRDAASCQWCQAHTEGTGAFRGWMLGDRLLELTDPASAACHLLGEGFPRRRGVRRA